MAGHLDLYKCSPRLVENRDRPIFDWSVVNQRKVAQTPNPHPVIFTVKVGRKYQNTFLIADAPTKHETSIKHFRLLM